jgi:hypothetical protein
MLEEGADALGGVAALKHSLVPVEQHLGGGVTGCTLGSTRPRRVSGAPGRADRRMIWAWQLNNANDLLEVTA